MNKNVKGLIVALVMGAAVGALYFLTHKTKRQYAKQIIKFNGTSQSFAFLMTMDEGYLKAWALALSKGQVQFVYNNESYNTQGGKKIVQ